MKRESRRSPDAPVDAEPVRTSHPYRHALTGLRGVQSWFGHLGTPMLAAVLVSIASDPYAFGLRARVSLALAALSLAGTLLVARHLLARASVRREVALVLGLALSLTLASLAANPALHNPPGFAIAAAAVLAACAVYLMLAAHSERPSERNAIVPTLPSWLLPVIVAVAFVMTWAVLFVGRENRPVFVDEVLYLFQASTLDEPGFGRRIDDELLAFFVLPLTFVADGRLHGQYPVGWPVLLGLAHAASMRTWVIALFGAASAALTYAVGRRLMPAWGAAIAAALLATNGMYLDTGGSFFAHVPTATFLLLGALALLRAEEWRGPARDAAFATAGFVLGVATAIRPMTGVAVGASAILWVLVRGRIRDWTVVRMLIVMALGAAAPLAAMLYYNAATTGDALVFGYTKAHGALHSLGFGVRGQIVYDSIGAPRPLAAPFTPRIALRNLVIVGTTFIGVVLPGMSAAIAIVVGWRVLARRRVLLAIVCFLLLPLLHFFVYYPDVRYYTELLPFVLLGVAWLLVRLRAERPAMAAALIAFAVAASAVAAAGRLRLAAERNEESLASVRLVESAHRRSGPILVFVSDPVPGESMLARLWAYNIDSFAGEVVVARDLGARNALLVRALPGRAVFRLRRTGSTTATLDRLP